MKREKLKSLVLNLVESIADLYEDETDFDLNNVKFDISKAIESKNYLFDPWKKTRGAPYIGNARIFVLNMFQKENNKFINLNLFFFNGSCSATFFHFDKKINNPWDCKNAKFFGETGRQKLIEISPEFQKEIIENEQLREIIKNHIVFNAKDESESIIQKQFKGLDNVNIKDNNKAIERRKQDNELKAQKEQLKVYADEQQKKLNRTYRYYKEYYRGPNGPVKDDDYAGSGEISLWGIADTFNCKTEKDIDELIDKLHEKGMYEIDGHYRTGYWEEKEK